MPPAFYESRSPTPSAAHRRGPAILSTSIVRSTSVVRRAFTIVEMIVVIILITVLAGLVAPRMLGTPDRAAAVEAEATRQLLTVLAQRERTGSEPLALVWDPKNNELSLEVRSRADVLGFASTARANSNKSEDDAWKRASLVRPVQLNTATLGQIIIDGRPVPSASLGTESWRWEFAPGQVRPVISIIICRPRAAAAYDGPGYQIDLTPGATSARVQELPSVAQFRGAMDNSEDLDSMGRRDSAW